MTTKNINICDTTVHPGEVANLALPLPELYSCSPLYMPIKVINGKKPGPCLAVFSVLKGTELNGLEIANRLVNSIDVSQIAGTIIIIPVLNVYALIHYPSKLKTANDLAKCFPGNEHGSYGERMAHLVTEEILKKADYCIELQTGDFNHNILPQVYCNFDDKRSRELAKVFKSPVITNVTLEGNAFRQTAEELKIPFLVYQAGEAMRFDENAIALGVEGVKNVMRSVDILAKEPQKEFSPIFSRDEDWLVAHRGGILNTTVSLGQSIEEGETIGFINDPFGAESSEPITSPQKGIVVGVNTSPLIHEGMKIFKVASFLDYEKAENLIEEWDKKQPDSFIG